MSSRDTRRVPRTRRGRVQWVRRGVQIFFVVLIATIAINHSLEEAGRSLPVLSSASLHAVCPFGGVVSIYQLATSGTYVNRIHESSFILMIIVAAMAIAVGPAFCGWVGPLGSIQEWVGRIGRRLFRKRYNKWVPRKLDRVLRYLRYLVLVWVVFMTARTTMLVFANIDPYYALFNFWTGEVAVAGLVVLGVVLLLSLFVERPFCKYLCPYGAFLGLSNLFRIFSIRRNADSCTSCLACDRSCPMNIKVSTASVVRDHQCITCMRCTSEQFCPVESTVELSSHRLVGSNRVPRGGEGQS